MLGRVAKVLVALAAIVTTSVGCEGLHETRYKDDRGTGVPESETSKIQAVDTDPKSPKPFFANDRLSGGWSSEARAIERHLGVGP